MEQQNSRCSRLEPAGLRPAAQPRAPLYAPTAVNEIPSHWVDEFKGHVAKKNGAKARPDEILFAAELFKTRSGKIMRRVIAAVSNFMDVGDVTTLANPEVVEIIRKIVQTEKAARGEVPKDLPKAVLEEIKRFGAAE